jgi:hypothetical protein
LPRIARAVFFRSRISVVPVGASSARLNSGVTIAEFCEVIKLRRGDGGAAMSLTLVVTESVPFVPEIVEGLPVESVATEKFSDPYCCDENEKVYPDWLLCIATEKPPLDMETLVTLATVAASAGLPPIVCALRERLKWQPLMQLRASRAISLLLSCVMDPQRDLLRCRMTQVSYTSY